jgi:predicted RNA-binding protein (virulence factor B family)
MLSLGRINILKINRKAPQGLYLDAGNSEEVLLPNKYINDTMHLGEKVSVMVYLDGEERPIATTEVPKAFINEYALLEIVDLSTYGGFLDWGLTKQLFIPYSEMPGSPKIGDNVFVYIYLDPLSSRIIASAKIDRFLEELGENFLSEQEVSIIPFMKTPLGFKCVVDFSHSGILYQNEIFQKIQIGQTYKGYIKKIREDKKLDLILQKTGAKKLPDISEVLFSLIQNDMKVAELNDKSSPELIYELTGMSKRNFKQALGILFKQGKVTIKK